MNAAESAPKPPEPPDPDIPQPQPPSEPDGHLSARIEAFGAALGMPLSPWQRWLLMLILEDQDRLRAARCDLRAFIKVTGV